MHKRLELNCVAEWSVSASAFTHPELLLAVPRHLVFPWNPRCACCQCLPSRYTRVMPVYQFVLALVLAIYVGFSRR